MTLIIIIKAFSLHDVIRLLLTAFFYSIKVLKFKFVVKFYFKIFNFHLIKINLINQKKTSNSIQYFSNKRINYNLCLNPYE